MQASRLAFTALATPDCGDAQVATPCGEQEDSTDQRPQSYRRAGVLLVLSRGPCRPSRVREVGRLGVVGRLVLLLRPGIDDDHLAVNHVDRAVAVDITGGTAVRALELRRRRKHDAFAVVDSAVVIQVIPVEAIRAGVGRRRVAVTLDLEHLVLVRAVLAVEVPVQLVHAVRQVELAGVTVPVVVERDGARQDGVTVRVRDDVPADLLHSVEAERVQVEPGAVHLGLVVDVRCGGAHVVRLDGPVVAVGATSTTSAGVACDAGVSGLGVVVRSGLVRERGVVRDDCRPEITVVLNRPVDGVGVGRHVPRDVVRDTRWVAGVADARLSRHVDDRGFRRTGFARVRRGAVVMRHRAVREVVSDRSVLDDVDDDTRAVVVEVEVQHVVVRLDVGVGWDGSPVGVVRPTRVVDRRRV